MARERIRLISEKRSVMVAADVQKREHLRTLCKGVMGVKGISAFKFGLSMGMEGLKYMVGSLREILEEEIPAFVSYVPGHVPVVYDHQKAGNDIPDMDALFVKKLVDAGINSVIFFPFAGPITQERWTKAAQDAGLHVITGGLMTHEKFLRSEGGYIADDAPFRILDNAFDLGVTDFVVPGNKVDWVIALREHIEKALGAGNFDLFGPGFIRQGGVLSKCGAVAGEYFHAIIGSGFYGSIFNPNSSKVVHRNALDYTSQLITA